MQFYECLPTPKFDIAPSGTEDLFELLVPKGVISKIASSGTKMFQFIKTYYQHCTFSYKN
jgi:hypothetical protein